MAACSVWSLEEIFDLLKLRDAMTREERLTNIREDAEQFEEPARSAFIALGQFQIGVPVDQHCILCNSAIRVWLPNPKNTQAWQTACNCGKCDGVFKGL